MKKLILISLALFALAACDNDPAKDKTKATVSDPVAPSMTASGMMPTTAMSGGAMNGGAMAMGDAGAMMAATPAGAVKYTFSNTTGSKVQWTGAKVTGKHDGTFETFTGAVNLVDGNPEKSTVNVDIDTSSLKVDPDKLAGHLKSADFFDVAKYPKATFNSTSIKAGGDKGATHTVTGNFMLHGVTKSITFPATITVAGDDVKVNAEFVDQPQGLQPGLSGQAERPHKGRRSPSSSRSTRKRADSLECRTARSTVRNVARGDFGLYALRGNGFDGAQDTPRALLACFVGLGFEDRIASTIPCTRGHFEDGHFCRSSYESRSRNPSRPCPRCSRPRRRRRCVDAPRARG